ncbi:hypothetical protein MTO96_032273 [Rhipicephalus appendiculatus]
MNKRVKRKRSRSLVHDEHPTDFSGPSKEVDAPTTHDSRKPAADISAPPSSNEKDSAATDGSAPRMLALRSDHEGSPHPTPIKGKSGGRPAALLGTGDDGEGRNEDPKDRSRARNYPMSGKRRPALRLRGKAQV